MAALEFKFSSDQQHQLEAIEATCDLSRGQQFIGSVFSADSGRKGQTAIDELMVGHGNELRVAPGQLLDNLHSVQEEGCLPATDVLTDGRLRDFTVEMETGTGKTYVYIRSIYELNRRYGITKFVIVVPSVAIREGVLKSFQTTRKHFETLYDRTPLDYFVYDSKDMGPVGNFATSSSIQVMVINIDAFNKGLEKDGTAKEGNLFHRPSERLTGGFSPRELVSACKPVVIIDEPQGAYYVMLDISEFGFDSDLEFCEVLARDVGVGAVPGSSFFREPVNHLIRLHFAKKDDTLTEALNRLADLRKKIPARK